MELIIEGRVVKALPVEQGVSKAGNNWMRQNCIIETNEQRPKMICLTIFGEDRLRKYQPKEGQSIKAYIDIESREYNGRYYTDVSAWKVEVTVDVTTQQGNYIDQQPNLNQQTQQPQPSNDLPF